ncbi:serine hydrolase [Paenibacillus urinalis]|uniref:Serine hydrolase n=1 Tax=Paenibacillus urinalis TaxID=521520 RepID=A0ABY7X461_9BACL|nr:serine hydrolase domain-containing protein [Paenibacillus urinalis]WDI00636.1 serine hydrolase [Paenibacillus urinalis]
MSQQLSQFEPMYRYIEQKVQAGAWPSAVLGITDKEHSIDLRSYGMHDHGTNIDSTSTYPVFSITKPMFGLAIMQLWEQGLLHPSQLITELLPEFGEQGKDKLALWHLLTHTSGLDESYMARWAQGKLEADGMNHSKIFTSLVSSTLTAAPGTSVSYNNIAFTVLAEIIERISGMTYEDYLKTHIFDPLGMKDTGFGEPGADQSRMAPIGSLEAIAGRMDQLMSAKLPFGGLISTADDLMIFAKAMLNETKYAEDKRLLQPLTFRQMVTPQTLHIDEVDSDYGFVWKMPARHKGYIERDIFGHNGIGGCMVWMYPKQGYAFVLMTAQLAKTVDNIHVHNVFSSCLNE